MKKKIFVTKNSRSGFRSSLKYILWGALILLILVTFVRLISGQKPPKELARKPSSDKGAVVKEIPPNLKAVSESIIRGQGAAIEGTKEVETKPVPAEPVEAQASGEPQGPLRQAIPKNKVAETSSKQQEGTTIASAKPDSPPASAEPPPSDAAPGRPASPIEKGPDARKAVSPTTGKPLVTEPVETASKTRTAALSKFPAQTPKPGPAESRQTSPATASGDKPKPEADSGKKLYAVQVASFKDKQSAEEFKKGLEKKGYTVVLKTSGDPKQGQSYSVQLQPVDNLGKASTMMEQVKYVQKAKPTIIAVPAGN